MSSIIDFSTIIVALAILGFIFKNVFYKAREWNVPYELKSQEDRYFSYISTALLALSIFWIFFVLVIVKDEKFIDGLNSFTEILDKIVEFGILPQEQILLYFKQVMLFAIFLSLFSPLYLMTYSSIFILGAIMQVFTQLINEQAVKVTLIEPKEEKKYKKIISESSDFIYFEILEDFRKWEGVKKQDIKCLERSTTKSNLSKRIYNLFKERNHWKDRNKRKKVILLMSASLITLVIVTSLFENKLLRYLISINAIIIAIMVLIENSFLNSSDEN